MRNIMDCPASPTKPYTPTFYTYVVYVNAFKRLYAAEMAHGHMILVGCNNLNDHQV